MVLQYRQLSVHGERVFGLETCKLQPFGLFAALAMFVCAHFAGIRAEQVALEGGFVELWPLPVACQRLPPRAAQSKSYSATSPDVVVEPDDVTCIMLCILMQTMLSSRHADDGRPRHCTTRAREMARSEGRSHLERHRERRFGRILGRPEELE